MRNLRFCSTIATAVAVETSRWRRIFSSLLFIVVAVAAVVAVASPLSDTSTANSAKPTRVLTFAERVAYQRAIEEVYWRHRIWPSERPDPKPSLDAVMSRRSWKRKWRIICANHRRWRITGNSRLLLSSYRLRWIEWRSTPNNPKCCANCLQRSGTIRL